MVTALFLGLILKSRIDRKLNILIGVSSVNLCKMKQVINLYKPVGLSPLQAIEKFKKFNRAYKNKKMGYAGRLDPMAEGVLLALVGDENKKMGGYLKLDKEYRAEILIGLKSDSCDVLGVVEKGGFVEVDEKVLKKKLKMLKGKYNQKIPKYSSYRFKGRPMFYYALRGKEVEDVKKVVEIKDVRINSVYKIGSGKLLKYVLNKIDKVDGKFRQKEIKEKWREVLEGGEDNESARYRNKDPPTQPLNVSQTRLFVVIDVTIVCSSGTYIRAIADDIGEGYGGGLLLSLKRIRVGNFDVRESEKLR